jgi:hypothetical protein
MMKYTQAQQVVEILRRHNIPARILTYGNPKTWDGFKVDAIGGKFGSVRDLLGKLYDKQEKLYEASAEVRDFWLEQSEVQ